MQQLLYSSKATYPIGHPSDVAIFETSLQNNTLQAVTGFLARSEHQFFQYLEGPRDAVDEIFRAIQNDPRNSACRLRFKREGSGRRFSQWQMGYFAHTRDLQEQGNTIWFKRATELPEGSEFLRLLTHTVQKDSIDLHQTLGHHFGSHQNDIRRS